MADRTRARTRALVGCSVAVAVLTWGCGDPFASGLSAIGRYTLTEVDGDGIPHLLVSGTQILSGTLTLDDEAACTSEVAFADSEGGNPSQAVATCSWTRQGPVLFLTWDVGPSAAALDGTVIDVTISATTPGCPFVPGDSCASTVWTFER